MLALAFRWRDVYIVLYNTQSEKERESACDSFNPIVVPSFGRWQLLQAAECLNAADAEVPSMPPVELLRSAATPAIAISFLMIIPVIVAWTLSLSDCMIFADADF